jgi:hypothetical protein
MAAKTLIRGDFLTRDILNLQRKTKHSSTLAEIQDEQKLVLRHIRERSSFSAMRS